MVHIVPGGDEEGTSEDDLDNGHEKHPHHHTQIFDDFGVHLTKSAGRKFTE